ncbi:hypothetical protein [Mesobacillus subterraneus]|uniref:Uncharacterized protein n=1 Tax=Mesobacillus subterraneus TaxID=285983 RepID=A0A3R9F4C4_9BACI|nr:hypothetical protein [Mesobacillus subterraneus]RSD28749.1 hypothetical protein EJA10_04020 [Mesobacillus subterraneus]
MEPRLQMNKFWTDADFFEVNLELTGNDCRIRLDSYMDNRQLEELRRGLERFPTNMGKSAFTWKIGSDSETAPFLSMKFFLHNKRGIVGIEIQVDNRMELPERMIAHFYILTEMAQLDRLAEELRKMINEEIDELQGLY